LTTKPCASKTENTLLSCTEPAQSNFPPGTQGLCQELAAFVTVETRNLLMSREHPTELMSAGGSIEPLSLSEEQTMLDDWLLCVQERARDLQVTSLAACVNLKELPTSSPLFF
jgi:hypothetical protein